jgi:hypothetical protein
MAGCGGAAFTVDGGPGDMDAAADGGGDGASTPPDSASPPVDASPDAAGCVVATVRLELMAASGESFCAGGSGAGCASDWVTVRPAGGGDALPLEAPCVTACNVCMPVACPALCAAPTEVPAGGIMRSWDGTYFASGTCGAGLSCATASCAPAGHYIATMCGYAKTGPDASVGSCRGVSTATCTDVPFDWPPSQDGALVVGTLAVPPADAGACCPAGSDLHACTFPDGGTGMACHDPAQGCASSTICGKGCDPVVTGRCADSD